MRLLNGKETASSDFLFGVKGRCFSPLTNPTEWSISSLAVCAWCACLCVHSWELKVGERRDKHHQECQSRESEESFSQAHRQSAWQTALRQIRREISPGAEYLNQRWAETLLSGKKHFKRHIPADTPKQPAHCNPDSFHWSGCWYMCLAAFTACCNANSSKKSPLLKIAREHVDISKHSAGAKKATVLFISHGAFELLNTSYIWCWSEQKPSSN